MVVGDVEDGEKINQTIAGAEVVYNFAALADLNEALNQPIKTVKINILGKTRRNSLSKAHLNLLGLKVTEYSKRFENVMSSQSSSLSAALL